MLPFVSAIPAHAEIAIDIGHSLAQPGARSAAGVSEFHFNRRLAQGISNVLAKNRIPHMLIGENGNLNSLIERTRLAAEHQAKIFASVHHDSIQPQFMARAAEFGGYSIFVSRQNPHYDQSIACAQRVGTELQKAGLRPSRYHAMQIPGENRAFVDERLGIHRYDGLAVLRTAKSPAILIEAGVIVNPNEEARLNDNRTTPAISQAIARGLAACLPTMRP